MTFQTFRIKLSTWSGKILNSGSWILDSIVKPEGFCNWLILLFLSQHILSNSNNNLNNFAIKTLSPSSIHLKSNTIKWASKEESQSSYFSIKRAFAHSFSHWKKNNVFLYSFGLMDHIILLLIPSILMVSLMIIPFFIFFAMMSNEYLFLSFIILVIIIAIPYQFLIGVLLVFIIRHSIVIKDTLSVFTIKRNILHNAKLKKMIDKLQNSTDYSVKYTRNPFLLVKIIKEKKLIIFNIGFIVKKNSQFSKRRILLLKKILKTLKEAIELDHAPISTFSSSC